LIDAVIFDLDGVLLDSESAWLAAKRAVVEEWGGRWKDEASRAMLGMSAPEWSVYMRDVLAIDRDPRAIDAEVVKRLLEVYRERLPLLPGAVEAVERLAARWPLGLASSSNLEVIEVVMEAGGFARSFETWVSSEEVARGKPAPDVFLEAARRMGMEPRVCAAVEDSHNGILAAHAAGMAVIALPNHEFPPGEEALERADRVLGSLEELTVEVVEAAGG
jgi:HAD superfamily hydrolase (TIGR01509 family)